MNILLLISAVGRPPSPPDRPGDRRHRVARAGRGRDRAGIGRPIFDQATLDELSLPMTAGSAAPLARRLGRDHRAARHPDPGPHPRRRGQPHLAVRRRHPLQRSRRRQRGAVRIADLGQPVAASRSCAGRNRRCGAAEALGGVIAADTADPLHGRAASRASANMAASTAPASRPLCGARRADVGVMASAGWVAQRRRRSLRRARRRPRRLRQCRSASLKLEARPSDAVSSAWSATGSRRRANIDGFDPVTFLRADTRDKTRNRIGAVRGWARGALGRLVAQGRCLAYLDSTNRNFLGGAPLNRTLGRPAHRRRAAVAAVRRPADRSPRSSMRTRISTPATPDYLRRHRSGPVAQPDRARRRMAGATGARPRHRPRRAARRFQRLRGRDHRSRRRADPAGPRLAPARRLWRRHRPADLLRSLRLLPRLVRGNPALKPERSTRLGGGDRLAAARMRPRRHRFSARSARRDRRHVRSRHLPLRAPPMRPARAGATASSSAPPGTGPRLQPARRQLYLAPRRPAAGRRRRRGRARCGGPGTASTSPLTGEAGRLRWGASLAYVGKTAGPGFRPLPGADGGAPPLCPRLGQSRLARSVTALEAYVRAENAFDAHYQDVVGYPHARKDGLCGSSRSLLAISLALAAARADGGAAARGVAEPVHRRAAAHARRAGADRLGDLSRPAGSGGDAALAARGALPAQRRQPAVGGARCGPIWS